MAWPPTPLPIDFANETVQQDTHPNAHNDTNLTLQADFEPEVTRLGGEVVTNAADIATNALEIERIGIKTFTEGSTADIDYNASADVLTESNNFLAGRWYKITANVMVRCEGTNVGTLTLKVGTATLTAKGFSNATGIYNTVSIQWAGTPAPGPQDAILSVGVGGGTVKILGTFDRRCNMIVEDCGVRV